MRFFIAFFIALTVYLLLFLLYIKNFSTIKLPSSQKNEHIIKITLKELTTPLPAKKKAEPIINKSIPPTHQSKPSTKVKSPKRDVPQKETPQKIKAKAKKRIVKKKIIKKKVVKKKKPIKKEAIVETPIEPFMIEKPIIEEMLTEDFVKNEELMQEEAFISEAFETEVPPLSDPILVEESNPINNPPSQFEQEMVYIAEPMLKSKKSQTKSNDLSSFLASPSNSTTSSSYPNSKIQQLYGASFQGMTSTQKAFIEENLETIQAITQRRLSQRGYPEGAGETGQEGTNVVVFNLHPNGDISDLRLKTRIGYRALDENTLSLIRVAYKDYPYPSSTTQIIFYVTYTINGY